MIYVVSDIHGHYDKLLALLEKIHFSDKDKLYILGDIIDRGPKIVKLVDFVISSSNIYMILGNHEDMFLSYMESRSYNDKFLWYRNGGAYTDNEFSLLPKEKISEYIEYFKGLPIEIELEVNGQNFWLVHGNYVTELERKKFTSYEYRMNILWSRIKKEDTGPKDKIVLFGHTPTKKYTGYLESFKIWKNGNVIGIDCGLAGIERYPKEAKLGCLCLDTMEEWYV